MSRLALLALILTGNVVSLGVMASYLFIRNAADAGLPIERWMFAPATLPLAAITAAGMVAALPVWILKLAPLGRTFLKIYAAAALLFLALAALAFFLIISP